MGALQATADSEIAYNESHDEAGNEVNTERNMVTAENSALVGDMRHTWHGLVSLTPAPQAELRLIGVPDILSSGRLRSAKTENRI